MALKVRNKPSEPTPESNDPLKEIDSRNRKAWNLIKYSPQEALSISSFTKRSSIESNYDRGLGESLLISGTVFLRMGLFDQCFNDLSESMALLRSSDAIKPYAMTLRVMGNAHLRLQDFHTAIDYYIHSIKLCESINDKEGLANNYGNLGYVSLKAGEHGKATYYLNKALEFARETNISYSLCEILCTLGENLWEIGEAKKGINFFVEAVKIAEEHDFDTGKALAYLSLGKYYSISEEKDKAENYFKLAIDILEIIPDHQVRSDVFFNYSQFLEKHGQYELALYYFKKHEEIRNEIYLSVAQTALHTITIQSELDRAELENETIKKQNRKMAAAVEEIDRKNKHITATINYASKIQSALLPSGPHIASLLPESFLIYNPKEIVSGDFYLVERINEIIAVVIGDCTGHGVPGAFMSLIGYNYLSQVLMDKKVLDPAQALTLLDDKITHALKQNLATYETIDAMDLAMCCVFPEKGYMEFAGAKRPMFIVRNGKIIEYKGNAYSIGGHYRKGKFFDHYRIHVERNDMIYMFTDGFSDQFGLTVTKKLKSKEMKEYFIRMGSLNCENQKEEIEENYESWIKQRIRLDDVCVLGFRIDENMMPSLIK